MKACVRCLTERPFSEFKKDKRKPESIRSYCLRCDAKTHKEWRLRNPDKIKAAAQSYKLSHIDHIQTYSANWFEANKDKKSAQNAAWKLQNSEHYKDQQSAYAKEKRKTDINFKLSHSLRRRMSDAIKKGRKTGSSVSDLGCSIEFLKTYLESKFEGSMSWQNHGLGKGKWQIDHIVPLKSFDLSLREDFLKAAHYSNLQPLWHDEHLAKTIRERAS